MDYVSITKSNRLFWLGRYYERVSFTLQFIMERYDEVIDTDDFDYEQYCKDLGIPNIYTSIDDFFQRYTLDVNDFSSVRNAAEQMLGNGMVLRETIGSPTLAYLQMAVYSLDEVMAKTLPLGLGLQRVLDNIMAFRGCYDDYLAEDKIRNILKSGASVERLSFTLRTRYKEDILPVELRKLIIRASRAELQTDPLRFQALIRQMQAFEGREDTEALSKAEFLGAVENLFRV